MRIAFILGLCMLLSACADIGLWLANRGLDFSGVKIYRDLAYGKAPWQKLDIYQPKNATSAPALLFLYGGGWSSGSKLDYRFIASRYTQRGMVVIIADYGTYPTVTFPAFVEDTALAAAWIVAHAQDYGITTDKLFVMGHSAGAYNGAMMLADPQYLAKHGLAPDAIRGFIGLAGPYAFTPTETKYKRIFNEMSDYSPMQVPHHINGTRTPMLLLHGEADTTVYPENSRLLTEALQREHSQAEYKIYEDIGHLGIIAGLTAMRENKKIVGDIDGFIDAQLR